MHIHATFKWESKVAAIIGSNLYRSNVEYLTGRWRQIDGWWLHMRLCGLITGGGSGLCREAWCCGGTGTTSSTTRWQITWHVCNKTMTHGLTQHQKIIMFSRADLTTKRSITKNLLMSLNKISIKWNWPRLKTKQTCRSFFTIEWSRNRGLAILDAIMNISRFPFSIFFIFLHLQDEVPGSQWFELKFEKLNVQI